MNSDAQVLNDAILKELNALKERVHTLETLLEDHRHSIIDRQLSNEACWLCADGIYRPKALSSDEIVVVKSRR